MILNTELVQFRYFKSRIISNYNINGIRCTTVYL